MATHAAESAFGLWKMKNQATEHSSDEATSTIFAYEIYEQSNMPLRAAPAERDWMDATYLRFAYRCLPLAMANQAGWLIHNPSSFAACWNGGPLATDTIVMFDQATDARITSLFGHGVVTFNMPYLFRTPQGINLWVKGPSNWIKDGIQALEGIVETDWTAASFTMNWKLTRPNNAVRFEQGDPICMIVPIPRGLGEYLDPRMLPLRCNETLDKQYNAWSASRDEFHRRVEQQDAEAVRRGWQKDYFHGQNPGSERFGEHQTKMPLKEFVRGESQK